MIVMQFFDLCKFLHYQIHCDENDLKSISQKDCRFVKRRENNQIHKDDKRKCHYHYIYYLLQGFLDLVGS